MLSRAGNSSILTRKSSCSATKKALPKPRAKLEFVTNRKWIATLSELHCFLAYLAAPISSLGTTGCVSLTRILFLPMISSQLPRNWLNFMTVLSWFAAAATWISPSHWIFRSRIGDNVSVPLDAIEANSGRPNGSIFLYFRAACCKIRCHPSPWVARDTTTGSFGKFALMKVPVVDVTQVVLAIHQNHDYAHHPGGQSGLWQDVEAKQNYALLGKGHFATIDNATHRLSPDGLHTNYYHWVVLAKRRAIAAAYGTWFGLLDLTRPLRRLLGLRERHSPEAPR